MKIYRLPELADLNPGGDFLLGAEELGTDAISILYGRISHGGPPRKVSAGDGRHAVLFVISGQMRVTVNRHTFDVSGGEAFSIDGANEACLENTGERESVYVLSAGRPSATSSAAVHIPQPSSVETQAPCAGSATEEAGTPAPGPDPAGPYGVGIDETGLDETEFEITRDDATPGGVDDRDEGR